MDGYPQVISMSKQMRKILFSIFIISVLSFFIFWGVNYTKINLASLLGIITAWVTINPLEVDVSAPAEAEINKVFKVEARVINKGDEKIENAKGEIFLPPELVLIRKDPIQEIGVIPGKKEKRASWTVKGEAVGNYIVSVKVSGELKGEIVTAEGSTSVKIEESIPRGTGRGWLQNLSDFFQKLFGI